MGIRAHFLRDLDDVLACIVELERTHQLTTISELKAQLEKEIDKLHPPISDRHRRMIQHRRKKRWKRIGQGFFGMAFVAITALVVGSIMADSFTSFRNSVYAVIVLGIVGYGITLVKRQ
ncbi:MAG: hypothetical protein V1800_15930 [Candidatus Latescibacterota bacterium]